MVQQYRIPGQNLSFNLPEVGEIFQAAGSDSTLFKRTADGIISLGGGRVANTDLRLPNGEILRQGTFITDADLHRKTGGKLAPPVDSSFRGTHFQPVSATNLFRDRFGQQNFQTFNLGDVKTAFDQLGFASQPTEVGDIGLFEPTPFQKTGEIFTQTVAPDNPQGARIKSSLSGLVSQSPSTQEVLTDAGATTFQGQVLGAAAAGNAGAPITAEQLGAAGVTLPPSQPPTSADQINNIQGITLPNQRQDVPDITGAIGAVGAEGERIKTQDQVVAEKKAARDSAIAGQDTGSQGFLDKLLGSQSPDQAREDAATQLENEPFFAENKARRAEIETLNAEHRKINEAMETEKATIQNRMASTGFISRAEAAIERRYLPRLNSIAANINSKTAAMESARGDFNSAQNFIDRAVINATAEAKFNLDLFQTFREVNQDQIDRLDSDYKDALDRSFFEADRAYEQQVREKEQIGQLHMENPDAGISIYSDSLEDAMRKVGDRGGNLSARRETRLGLPEVGGGGLTTTERNNLSDYLTEIGSYGSREEALTDLATNSTKIIVDVGQQGFNTLEQEINRRFPETPGEAAAPLSAIEQRIADLKSGPVPLSDADIRHALKGEHSQSEINASSAGSLIDRIGEASSNFFDRLFGA